MPLEKLDRFINNESLLNYKNYTLKCISSLLNISGNPQNNYNTVHIAGTNGKGSTAHYLNRILINSGYRTGLYTSPHMLRINERISINNELISDEELNNYIDDAVTVVDSDDSLEPTFFDMLTYICFRYFSDKKVDIAIVETGMGGKLDSTNVINPISTIITDISYDHTAVLGLSLTDIAHEKAGIIKNRIPVITSNSNRMIMELIRNISEKLNSSVLFYDIDFMAKNISEIKGRTVFDYQLTLEKSLMAIDKVEISLNGLHQVKNCCMAITAAMMIKVSYDKINNQCIKAGLINLKIPGRFQVIRSKPFILFDPAHNVDALDSALEVLKNHYSEMKIIIVLSLMKDKDYQNILSRISEFGAPVIYYNLNDERGFLPEGNEFNGKINCIVDSIDNLEEAVNLQFGDGSLLFFTGSFRIYKIALDFSNIS